MGQSTSFESPVPVTTRTRGEAPSSPLNLSNELDFLHDQIRRHSTTIRQLANLNHHDLINKITELNTLSSKYVDCNGKQLMFEASEGSDSTILWKATVRIKCIKLDPIEQKIEKTRELNLKQFIQLYNTMQNHLAANSQQTPTSTTPIDLEHQHNIQSTADQVGQSSSSGPSRTTTTLLPQMDASILMDKLEKSAADDKIPEQEFTECCICMEFKPEVTLPCAHSYCLACIEQWNMDHKTCPICREKLETTDETWVLEEAPTNTDISHEIQKNLFDLTR